MRIAQVAPLMEPVPPAGYGGTERVVSYLTEELVRLGHEVTLFASGDSRTSARLVPCCERALRLDPLVLDPLAHHVAMLERVFRDTSRFDVMHFHMDYLHFPLTRRQPTPAITTLHGRLDLPDLPAIYRVYRDAKLISISDSQRAPIPWANWEDTVHHGIPDDLFSFNERPGDYVAFLGRISPEKRIDRAIEIARRAGVRIRIAAKLDRADREYHDREVRDLLRAPHVEFLGEVGGEEKASLLANARALLFPIDWPEPFGLVMIEAMACGTPVIAWRNGSVPEVVRPGVTGFVVDDLDAAVEAVGDVPKLSRRRVRAEFERRFTARRMAEDYLAIYRRLVEGAAGAQGAGAIDAAATRSPRA